MQAAATAPSTLVPAADAFGLWDFAADMSTDRVTDRSPDGAARPDRERAQARGHRPQLERHRDGLAPGARSSTARSTSTTTTSTTPAGGPSLTTTIPPDARSGVYALRLQADGGPDFWAVFYVRPPRRGRRAPVAFLASTATYLAYSNYRARMRPGPAELYIGALPVVDPTDLLLMHHPELGGSTYDTHSDGSGVCHVSWRRPILNVRPTGRLWNLFLDFCLLDWLEAHDQPYDVITDDDLHAEGLALLADYRGRPHRLSSRVLLARRCWTRCRLPRPRRPAHVHGRQRLLLARLVSVRRTPG